MELLRTEDQECQEALDDFIRNTETRVATLQDKSNTDEKDNITQAFAASGLWFVIGKTISSLLESTMYK